MLSVRLPRCIRGCVSLRVLGLLLCYTDVLHVLKVTLVACVALSRSTLQLLAVVRTFSHMCGVADVVSIDSPVPNFFCMTPRFSERFP